MLDTQLRFFDDEKQTQLKSCVDVGEIETPSPTTIIVGAGAMRIELAFADAAECADWQTKVYVVFVLFFCDLK